MVSVIKKEENFAVCVRPNLPMFWNLILINYLIGRNVLKKGAKSLHSTTGSAQTHATAGTPARSGESARTTYTVQSQARPAD